MTREPDVRGALWRDGYEQGRLVERREARAQQATAPRAALLRIFDLAADRPDIREVARTALAPAAPEPRTQWPGGPIDEAAGRAEYRTLAAEAPRTPPGPLPFTARQLAVAMAEEGFAVAASNRDEQWDAPYAEAERILARLAAGPQDSGHRHRWVDARNEVVLSGEVCPDCGAIRAGPQDSEPQG